MKYQYITGDAMKLTKSYTTNAIILSDQANKLNVGKHINADNLFALVRDDFKKVPDTRADNVTITMDNALISVLAMFQLRDPSLLAFDIQRREEPENLHTIYDITNIPYNSQMRTLLDPVELHLLRTPFLSVFRQLQRGKDLEKMTDYDSHYLLSADGTGFYSSHKVSSLYCVVALLHEGKEAKW